MPSERDEESHAISGASSNTISNARLIKVGAAILPENLALIVSRLSYVGTLSIRSSALLAEAALEGARIGTITSLEVGRKTLEALVTSVFDILVRDSNNFGATQRGPFGNLVEKYSNLGVHPICPRLMLDLSCLSYIFAGGIVFDKWICSGSVGAVYWFCCGGGECSIC